MPAPPHDLVTQIALLNQQLQQFSEKLDEIEEALHQRIDKLEADFKARFTKLETSQEGVVKTLDRGRTWFVVLATAGGAIGWALAVWDKLKGLLR